MTDDLISNSWGFGITWNCTWPPVLNFPYSPPKDKNMTDDLISTIWGAQITCNCTRPPVEQPDHRRRLILAPKPSSALLYNTHPPLHLYVSHTKPSKLYSTNLPQLNTSLLRLNTRSSPYCSPFWVLRTQHRTRYCTLLSPAQQPHFCTTLGWRAYSSRAAIRLPIVWEPLPPPPSAPGGPPTLGDSCIHRVSIHPEPIYQLQLTLLQIWSILLYPMVPMDQSGLYGP